MTAQPSKARQVGCLIADLPAYCKAPPIEVVVFGWGVTEDGQLGLDDLSDVTRPSVIESLLGTNFSGFRFNRRPIVAGSRNTLAVTETGRVLSWGWNDRGTLGVGHRYASALFCCPFLAAFALLDCGGPHRARFGGRSA